MIVKLTSPKVFTFDKLTVFFKHTDYHGFLHPYNYFEWMSYAREAYFQELVSNFLELCDRNIKMVTASVELELLNDAIFGDPILCKIYSENVRRLSFDVIFDFCHKTKGIQLSRGRQRLTFLDADTVSPARIPEELKTVVLQYEKKDREAPLLDK